MSNQKNDNSCPIIMHSKSEEKQCAEQLKHWLETQTKFYGRTDEDFLLMFVRGCKHDVEKAKKKLYIYYENRKKVPQWWANRDIDQLKSLIQLKGLTVLPDNYSQLPTFGIFKLSKVPASSQHFDDYVKVLTIYMDITLRRPNCQANGLVGIFDFTDYPLYVLQKILSPIIVYNLIHGFYTAMPLRLKQVHLFNFPLLGRAAWRLIKALLPPKIKNRIWIYGSDLTSLQSNIDNRLLPEEYGGQNGCLVDHDEAFLEEVLTYCDYFSDDNKYGFQ